MLDYTRAVGKTDACKTIKQFVERAETTLDELKHKSKNAEEESPL